jgi:single-stranded-DNA-specific exonuclease
LRRFLPDPLHLKDMDVRVRALVRAVQAGERIVVFGDYDVDGATSSALLAALHPQRRRQYRVYIPDGARKATAQSARRCCSSS